MLLNEADKIETDGVWEHFRADLLGFIRRRVHDDAVADDLLQDAFERIHRGIDGLSDQRRLASWIHAVVRNVITDHYRKARPTEPLPELVDEPQRDDNDYNKLVGGWLMSMIDDLPEEYRLPVRMVEVEGLPHVARVEFDRRGNVVDVESRNGCC